MSTSIPSSSVSNAQSARYMLIKLKNAQDEFQSVVGLRTKSLRFNAQTIDITHSESEAAWRELLPGAGIKSVELSGSGIFCNGEIAALIRAYFFAQSANVYQIILPGFGTITGQFLLRTLTYSGNYDGEANYDLQLQSTGVPEFMAVA